MERKNKIPVLYKILSHWIRFFHNHLYYRKVYFINTENIPPKGTPLVVVSNHQNSLNDALAIVLSIDLRRPRFLTRGDIFKNPTIAKLLYFFGLIPIYRQRDGLQSVKTNLNIFNTVEEYIDDGHTLVLFPEAGHQDGHYLGRFFLSYTRLAFNAAKRSNFEKEVFIVPCANHYNDYFNWREELVMSYGTPVSLKPFYQLYQEQPRQAQIEVDKIVKAQVESLMLHIPDLENYDSIYFILQTYGRLFAVKNGYNPQKLPEKLASDQKLTKILMDFHQQHTEKSNELYALATHYHTILKELKISDDVIEKPLDISHLLLHFSLYILGFPVFLYGYLHHLIPYNIPRILGRNLEDKLMYPSINIGVSAMAGIPLFYILFFIISLFFIHPLLSVVYVFTLPVFGIFAWNYRKRFFVFVKKWRYNQLINSQKNKTEEVLNLHQEFYDKMNTLVSL